MAYNCHLCDGAEQAVMLVTPLAGGDTMAIGADCMLTGLCGLLSVHAQVDTERLYDALVTLQQAEADEAIERAQLAEGSYCMAVRETAPDSPCVRSINHRGNHKDAQGHQWRNARAAATQVPESQPAAP